MTKHCKCHVISFPASIDQCHWLAIAGSHSIVRYGLGTGGQHEGIIFTTLTYPYMLLPQYLPTRQLGKRASYFTANLLMQLLHEQEL